MKRKFINDGKNTWIEKIKREIKHSKNYIELRKKKKLFDEKYKNFNYRE